MTMTMTMTTPTLRWAILGTGAIARRFAGDMRFCRSGAIVAVASRRPERAAAFAAALGPGVASGTAGEMLALAEVDAVYVATPNERHAPDALAAIAAGKRAVLVEKPFALARSDVEEVAAAAREAGAFCMEAMWMRFTPGIVRLKRLVAEGAIGEIVSLQAGVSFARAYDPRSRLYSPEGGGALFDLGVYPVSLALHLCGRPDSVSAARLAAPNGAIRQASLVLGYPEALASLHCSFDAAGANEAVVTGTRGILTAHAPMLCPPTISLRPTAPGTAAEAEAGAADRAPAFPSRPRFGRARALRQMLSPLNIRRHRRYPTLFEGSGLQYQADHVAACLAEGRLTSPVMPMEETAEAIAILRRAMDA